VIERIGHADLYTTTTKVWSYAPPYTDEDKALVGKKDNDLTVFRIVANASTGRITFSSQLELDPSKYPEIVSIFQNTLSVAEDWLAAQQEQPE
jgi:hypothetical protein